MEGPWRLPWRTTPLVRSGADILLNVHKTPSWATSCKEAWTGTLVDPCLLSGGIPPPPPPGSLIINAKTTVLCSSNFSMLSLVFSVAFLPTCVCLPAVLLVCLSGMPLVCLSVIRPSVSWSVCQSIVCCLAFLYVCVSALCFPASLSACHPFCLIGSFCLSNF